MRLIDADALNEKLCKTTIFIKGGEIFQRMINDAPTIDAVEVVRCKDCKCSHIEGNTTQYRWCKCLNVAINDDDYCSHAERRES